MEEKKKIISQEEVEKVAELSRIKLSEEEKEKVTGQLDSVLSSVEVLEEIEMIDFDTQEFSEKLEYGKLREDQIKEIDEAEKEAIKENFSSRNGDFLSVKSMF